jgi:transglutaminase-like putative cysteine protease
MALALRLAAVLLVLCGLAALALARLLGPVALALALAAVVVSWWRERIAPRVRPAVGWTLAAAASAAVVVDLVYLAETALDGLVRALVGLVLFRLFTLSSPREAQAVAFLSFFMLVAASSATLSVSFLLVLVAFLGVVTWLLLLQHLTAESEPARRGAAGPGAQAAASRTLIGISAVAAAGALLVTAGLFFVIPRVGLAAMPIRARLGQMVTGFADRVELGAYGQIETDPTVVMRVHVPEGVPEPHLLPNLRWRGIAFDEFDGRAWSVGQAEPGLVRRSPGGRFSLAWPRGTGRPFVHEVYLDPIGADVIFLAPRALSLTLATDAVVQDAMDSVSVPAAGARLHYIVESELEEPAPRPRRLGAEERLAGAARARYLQLPRLPARIGQLARQVTDGSRDPYEAARRLQTYLSREFRYTLALTRTTDLDPVDEFLFERRSGNCEYFAAALAVMLRDLGTPARVVGGFQRGEWNPYGRYFMVRMSDAHSWVEAYFDDRGWLTLDPSPRGDPDPMAVRGPFGLYLDALRMRWYRYVINWSLRDQIEVALTLRSHARAWRPRGPAWSEWGGGVLLLVAALGLTGVVGGALLRARRVPRSAARRRRPPVPPFYRRALRILARRGFSPRAAETAREFSCRVAEAAPALAPALGQVTAAYERVRFGAAVLGLDELGRLESSVRALRRRGVAPPISPSPG